MDEQLVYTITKILDESREELISAHPSLSNLSDPEYICSQLPIPLHPGAEKYYTEQGLVKTEQHQNLAHGQIFLRQKSQGCSIPQSWLFRCPIT